MNAMDVKPEGSPIPSGRDPDGNQLLVPDVRKVFRNPEFDIGNKKKWLELNDSRRLEKNGRIVP